MRRGHPDISIQRYSTQDRLMLDAPENDRALRSLSAHLATYFGNGSEVEFAQVDRMGDSGNRLLDGMTNVSSKLGPALLGTSEV